MTVAFNNNCYSHLENIAKTFNINVVTKDINSLRSQLVTQNNCKVNKQVPMPFLVVIALNIVLRRLVEILKLG